MIIPQIPANEVDRLAALNSYQILDTHAEAAFDALTRSAALVCDVPIAMISLVDRDRQWFKSVVGSEATQTSREVSFCGHAIHSGNILEVPDALTDARFFDNPLVTGAPNIRFYAGAPLTTPEERTIGTLCVIDRKPRRLTAQQHAVLAELSIVVMRLLEGRKAEAVASYRSIEAIKLLEMGERIAHFGHFHFDGAARKFRVSNELFQINGVARGVDGPAFDDMLRAIHPDDRSSIVALGDAAIATGTRQSREHRIVRPDGTLRHVDMWIEPGRSSDGASVDLFGVVQDITERKQAEIATQRERDRYNAIFDTVGDGILITSLCDGPVHRRERGDLQNVRLRQRRDRSAPILVHYPVAFLLTRWRRLSIGTKARIGGHSGIRLAVQGARRQVVLGRGLDPVRPVGRCAGSVGDPARHFRTQGCRAGTYPVEGRG